MSEHHLSIFKLKNEDKSLTYRVKPEWEEASFKITIFLEDSTAWQANITKEELKKLAKERSQSVADYYNTIKQYFIQTESNVSFDLKLLNTDQKTANFIIKRKVGGRTILYFNAKLVQINFQDNLFDLLDELLEKHSLLYQDMENVKRKITEEEENRKLYQNKLTEFVNLKSNWEREMYSNFVIVLNEKKKRIKFLTDLLSRKNINPDAVQETMEVNTSASVDSSPIPKRKLESISDSDSNSEYDTDRESNAADVDIEMDPTPSTSKHTLQIDEDSPPQLLSLPKFSKKGSQKSVFQKIKPVLHETHEFLTEETQPTEDVLTQEPYMSTQERIDRM